MYDTSTEFTKNIKINFQCISVTDNKRLLWLSLRKDGLYCRKIGELGNTLGKPKNPAQKGLASGTNRPMLTFTIVSKVSWLYHGASLGYGEYLA